ncbi:MAG TPA: hypothetical protein PLB21_00700 [Actinomycetota bacterium]|nr:hypothetical protein [Actinomycetota bacterium]
MLPVAFVPSTPLLHPEIAGSAAVATAKTRGAARRAVDTLLSRTTVLVLGGLGIGGRPPQPTQHEPVQEWPASTADCLPGFGLAGRIGAAEGPLPLSLSLGRLLLMDGGFDGAMKLISLHGSPQAVTAGAHRLDLPPDCGLLVVGDGTATRTDKSPGHHIAGAAELDDHLAEALRAGDPRVFNRLPTSADTQFLLDGRCAWQGAVTISSRFGSPRAAELLAFEAPHGVAYFVATWLVGEPNGDAPNQGRGG